MKKRAQIQIGETIAVLFVFFVLVAIGFVFYAAVIKSNVATEKEELSQLKSVGIAQRVMFLPEVQCSENNVVTENCVDAMKLDAAEKTMRDNSIFYFDLLEFSEVNVTQVYPPPTVTEKSKWSIYSRKTENSRNSFLTRVPISIFDPKTRTYRFGVLSIETKTK